MEDDVRVLELLETLMDTGGTPEEVCSECPELLPAVREQWEQCRRLDARIDALFNVSGQTANRQNSGPVLASSEFPTVPGYELISQEGKGGMGIVYRARHLTLNRIIALKMLLAGPFASRNERARFLREAQAVAALHHANIVQIYDVGEFEGGPFSQWS